MYKNNIDILLDCHFSILTNKVKLDSLEYDVMQLVKENKNNMVWYDKMFNAFSVPQFQAVSLVFALFVGVGFSSIMPINEKSIQSDFKLEDFSYNAPHLTLNLSQELR